MPGAATKARRILRPSSVRMGIFCKFGSDDDNRRILDEVNASGKFFISHTELRGRYVLRLAIGNLGTAWEDVQGAWEMIKTVVRSQ